jgi:rod shape-determining protein MreC
MAVKRLFSGAKRHKGGIVLASLLSSSFVLFLLSTNRLVDLPKQVGLSVSSFFQGGFNAVSDFFVGFVESIGELGELKSKYDAAIERMAELEAATVDLDALKAENARLKQLLEYQEAIEYDSVPARVIARDPGNSAPSLVISKGARDGIKRAMPVLAFQDGARAIVGKVVEVGLQSSVVLPLYASSSYIPSRVESSRVEGLIQGGGFFDKSLFLRHVPKRSLSLLTPGDYIVSSGMGDIYPSEVRIGTIARIQELEYSNSLMIEVDPLIDFSRLEHVFILAPKGAMPSVRLKDGP